MSDTTTRATTALREPSQLVIGMSHREMLALMAEAGICCSTDRFARILQDVQRRALLDRDRHEVSQDPPAEPLSAWLARTCKEAK